MLRKLARRLAKNPSVYTLLRRIIEANFRSHKRVIRQELDSFGTVLDIACGIGEFSVFFDKDKYTGIDITEAYVEYGKKKYKKNLLVGDAMNLDFQDNSFDSVLISGFFHHLEEHEIAKVLNEAYRVLKNNGKLLLIEDAPGKRFLTRWLQKYDVGANIREMDKYILSLTKLFKLQKAYPMRSGLWDYSVFVMRK